MRPFDGEAFLTSQMKDSPGFPKFFSKGKPSFFGAAKARAFMTSRGTCCLSVTSRLATAAVRSSNIIGHLLTRC